MNSMEGWPVDEEGKPMARISAGANEKVGLPNYSNIDIGPMNVTRFVPDSPETIREGLRMCVQITEQVIAEERDAVVQAVKKAKEGTILSG